MRSNIARLMNPTPVLRDVSTEVLEQARKRTAPVSRTQELDPCCSPVRKPASRTYEPIEYVVTLLKR
jgi:hypothetical protein